MAPDGFRVDPEELRRLAEVLGSAGLSLLGQAARVQAVMTDPALLENAVLAPAGLARVESAVVRACEGRSGLLEVAASLGAAAAKLEATRVEYEVADSAVAGRTAALLGVLEDAPVGLQTDPFGYARRLGGAVGRQASAALTGAAPWLDLPLALVEMRVLGPMAYTPQGRDVLAHLIPEGPGAAAQTRLTASEFRPAPEHSLSASMAHVAQLEADRLHNNVIAVTPLPGEPPRYRVELPGIHSLLPGPDPMTLPGAAAAELGTSTAYTRAVQQALDQAGVPRGAEVMLVGHSQGGIVAMDLAGDPAFNGDRVHVSHVLAAGSPISSKEVAPGSGTAVLSVENTHDLVVHADAASREDSAGRLTYSFSHDTGSVGGNHAATAYAEQMKAVLEDSPNPAMRAFSSSAQGYYADPAGPTKWFALTEQP